MSPTARFAILEHDYPVLHWDFMLEAGDVLRTWRLPAVPATGEMIAEQIEGVNRRSLGRPAFTQVKCRCENAD